jgi:hypothetical protein
MLVQQARRRRLRGLAIIVTIVVIIVKSTWQRRTRGSRSRCLYRTISVGGLRQLGRRRFTSHVDDMAVMVGNAPFCWLSRYAGIRSCARFQLVPCWWCRHAIVPSSQLRNDQCGGSANDCSSRGVLAHGSIGTAQRSATAGANDGTADAASTRAPDNQASHEPVCATRIIALHMDYRRVCVAIKRLQGSASSCPQPGVLGKVDPAFRSVLTSASKLIVPLSLLIVYLQMHPSQIDQYYYCHPPTTPTMPMCSAPSHSSRPLWRRGLQHCFCHANNLLHIWHRTNCHRLQISLLLPLTNGFAAHGLLLRCRYMSRAIQ